MLCCSMFYGCEFAVTHADKDTCLAENGSISRLFSSAKADRKSLHRQTLSC